MAATDDPLFLRLSGPSGREFRLMLAKSRTLRRGEENVFVLGGSEANIEHADLNDPGAPQIHGSGIERVEIFKSMAPIPNVRGVAELDDRVQLDRAEVELHSPDFSSPRRFERQGPFWLGLVCGFCIELATVDRGA